jgi:hypothetical protein
MDGERRAHERVAVKVPLYVELSGGIFQKNVAITAQNVSKAGLSFETHRPLPVGADARLMVARLGDLPDVAQIEAQIVHCQKSPDGSAYTVGVRFTRLVGVSAEELVTRLASR